MTGVKYRRATEEVTEEQIAHPLLNGPAMAAVLSASIGAFVLGLFTTLNEASAGIHDFLQFSDPVGPLSGKAAFAVLGWLVSWGILHAMWRRKDVAFARVVTWSFVLLALGVLGTFPSFFESFAAE